MSFLLAWENRRFSSLITAREDVSLSPSGDERGEACVFGLFAGYFSQTNLVFEKYICLIRFSLSHTHCTLNIKFIRWVKFTSMRSWFVNTEPRGREKFVDGREVWLLIQASAASTNIGLRVWVRMPNPFRFSAFEDVMKCEGGILT